MIRPSIRQLSYLTAIEDHGSFIKAAEECGVTQSTLSAGIKELETVLDQQLVIRGRKKATLTPFGIEVAQQAREILEDTDRIVSRSKLLKEPMSGPLRLGIIPTIAPYMLPEILPKINERFPRLELQLHEDITDRLLEKSRRGHIDVILMAFPYETPDFVQYMLFEEKFYAATPKDNTTDLNSLHIEDLQPETLLLLEDGHCLRDHALSACDIQLHRQKQTFSATSLPTLIHMVQAGYGVTLLPEMACQQNIIPDNIRLLPFNDPKPPTRQIGLAWKSGDPRRRDYDLLAECIK